MPFFKTRRQQKAVIHLIFFLLSISVAYLLAISGIIHGFLERNRELTLLTAFVSGIFYTSGFTSIPAVASLFILSQDNNPLMISVIASVGSFIGDILLLKVFRKEINVTEDGLLDKKNKTKLTRVLQFPVIRHFIILVALIVIASPLPDELGIGLFGLINFKTKYFAWLSLILNFLGISSITLAAHYF